MASGVKVFRTGKWETIPGAYLPPTRGIHDFPNSSNAALVPGVSPIRRRALRQRIDVPAVNLVPQLAGVVITVDAGEFDRGHHRLAQRLSQEMRPLSIISAANGARLLLGYTFRGVFWRDGGILRLSAGSPVFAQVSVSAAR
jgi:hypothetical protein